MMRRAGIIGMGGLLSVPSASNGVGRRGLGTTMKKKMTNATGVTGVDAIDLGPGIVGDEETTDIRPLNTAERTGAPKKTPVDAETMGNTHLGRTESRDGGHRADALTRTMKNRRTTVGDRPHRVANSAATPLIPYLQPARPPKQTTLVLGSGDAQHLDPVPGPVRNLVAVEIRL
jgi:hypothetical protein